MSKEDHKAVLRDETRFIVERIQAAAKLDLVYWKDRADQPNLDEEEFRKMLPFIPRNARVRWEAKKSIKGPHGRSGEDRVFNIEFEIVRGRFRLIYYLKGFFFDKNDLKGVCIQSFRLKNRINRTSLRII